MLKVLNISQIEPYKLHVVLSNGKKGVFDVAPYLDKGIFVHLQNMAYFQRVRINFCGICWPNGQDFSADTIEHDLQPDA